VNRRVLGQVQPLLLLLHLPLLLHQRLLLLHAPLQPNSPPHSNPPLPQYLQDHKTCSKYVSLMSISLLTNIFYS